MRTERTGEPPGRCGGRIGVLVPHTAMTCVRKRFEREGAGPGRLTAADAGARGSV
jgi:hypothetical protein